MESKAVTEVAHDVVTVGPKPNDNSGSTITSALISCIQMFVWIEMVLTGSILALETSRLKLRYSR